MKTTFLIFSLSVMILLSIETKGQNNSKLVIIQLYDTPAANSRDAFIITLTPENEKEIISLEKNKTKPEEAANNYLHLKKEIEKWMANGYELIQITSEEWSAIPRTSAILSKKE